MPAPNPLLPSDIQWGYRSGVERHSFRIQTAAASDSYVFICTGSKRLLALNVINASTPLGTNATLQASASTSAGSNSVVLISEQALPTQAAQYVPDTISGRANVSRSRNLFGVIIDNPDTDALDLLCEMVWVPAADSSNTAIDSQASVTAMTFP
jgi:hypothetical protein